MAVRSNTSITRRKSREVINSTTMTSVLSPPVSASPPKEEEDDAVIVVESSDDEEPSTKRRRTGNTGSVIDLTEVGDDNGAEHVRFRLLPKMLLTPFQFTDDSDDEPANPQLASISDHIRQLFNGVFPTNRPPSPINPDELEITGVKESSSSSSTSTTTTSSSSISPNAPTTNNKVNNKQKQVTLECPICLGEMESVTATTCGHIFCKECIKAAIKFTKCCPMCKKKLTQSSIHPIYL